MEAQSVEAKSISFQYLSEFREWLVQNGDAEILDITTTGGFHDMRIVVAYRLQ